MNAKKILALLLAVMMLLALMAGCGSSSSSEPAAEEPAAPAEEPAAPAAEPAAPAGPPAEPAAPEGPPAGPEGPPAAEPAAPAGESIFPLAETKELSFYCPLQPFTMPYGIGPEQMYNFEYLEEATNIHINLDCINFMQNMETFNIMIASQDYDDFIGSFESNYRAGAEDALANNVVIDLYPYLENELANYKAALDQDKNFWMYSLTTEGHLISANYLMPGGEPMTAGAQYRGDWLEELGMDVPETYDEVYDYLVQAKDKFGSKGVLLQDVGVDGELILAGGFDTIGYSSQQANSHPFMQIDNVVEFGPANQGYHDYLALLADWYQQGLIYPDYASIAWNEMMDEVAKGQVALWSSSYDAAQTILDNTEGAVRMVGGPQPTKTAGEKVHQGKMVTLMLPGTAISTSCDDLETALAWVNFRYSEEGQLITGYGKEGLTYEMVDGKPQLTDLVLHNEEYVLIVAVNLYTSYGTPGIVDPVRYSGGWTDVDRAVIEAYNDPDRDFAHMLPLTYVTIDSTVSQEYSAIMSDIATYVQQYTADVINGNVKIDDTWDGYLAQLESMEIAKATGFMQNAWDNYLAKEQYIP